MSFVSRAQLLCCFLWCDTSQRKTSIICAGAWSRGGLRLSFLVGVLLLYFWLSSGESTQLGCRKLWTVAVLPAEAQGFGTRVPYIELWNQRIELMASICSPLPFV